MLGPFFLQSSGRKNSRTTCLLNIFHLRFAKYEGNLIRGSRGTRYSMSTPPSPTYSFTRILKIKLQNLVRKSGVLGHYNTPAVARGSHGCHLVILFPFCINPFDRKRVIYLVALAGVRGSLRHNYRRFSIGCTRKGCDEEFLFPLVCYIFLMQKLI